MSAPTHGLASPLKFEWQCTHVGENAVDTAIDLRTIQRPLTRSVLV